MTHRTVQHANLSPRAALVDYTPATG
jgi:hypothetical protein